MPSTCNSPRSHAISREGDVTSPRKFPPLAVRTPSLVAANDGLCWRTQPVATEALAGLPVDPSRLSVSVSIESGSELYELMSAFLSRSGSPKNFELAIGRGCAKGGCTGSSKKASLLCKGNAPRVASLGLGLGLFEVDHDGHSLIALHQTLGAPVGTSCGVSFFKELVLFASSTDVITGLTNSLLEQADRTKKNTITIYRFNTKYEYWKREQTAPARPLESVVLPGEAKDRLVQDVEEFESEDAHAWYLQHGIPYKRSYLFYGVPGAGKTSLIQALAGKHGRNVCFLSPTHPDMTDDGLRSAVQRAPPNSLIILEDVDALFGPNREKKVNSSPLTFSGLLNALDGVGGAEGQIFILTTNLRDELDPALIRNGRVDLHLYFGHAEEEQMKQLFLQFYDQATDEQAASFAAALSKSLGDEKVSMAALQHFFVVQRRRSAVEAIKRVGTVKEELEHRKDEQKKKDDARKQAAAEEAAKEVTTKERATEESTPPAMEEGRRLYDIAAGAAALGIAAAVGALLACKVVKSS